MTPTMVAAALALVLALNVPITSLRLASAFAGGLLVAAVARLHGRLSALRMAAIVGIAGTMAVAAGWPIQAHYFQHRYIGGESLNVGPHHVPPKTSKVRYWDLAASEPSASNPDPDWTVGILLEFDNNTAMHYVTEIVRTRKAAGAVELLVRNTAERDGREVPIVIGQDAGGAGKALTSRYIREVLRGYIVHADRVTGSKLLRAQPVAAAAENGYVRVVRGRHTDELLDELSSFPHGRHDECVDALAGAHKHVRKLRPSGTRTTSVPRGRIPGVDRRAERWGHRTHATGRDPVEELAWKLGARIYDTR